MLGRADGPADARKDLDSPEKASDFFSLLKTSPSDWQLILHEKIALIDWDAKARTHAQPCGNFLTLLFFMIRLLQDNLIKPNYHKINVEGDAFDFSKSEKLRRYDYLAGYSWKSGTLGKSKNDLYFWSLGRLAKVFDVSIVILLLWNAISTLRFLFVYYRTYTLLYLSSSLKSGNLTKRNLVNLEEDSLQENTIYSYVWAIFKFLFPRVDKGSDTAKDFSEDDTYYELKKWVPSNFTVRFLVSFSPTCLIFLLLSEVSFRTAFAVIIHQYILYFFIVRRYENRLIDDSILSSALNAEFDHKFVRPNNSKMQQDAQVDATPYGDGYVRFYPKSNKSKIFKSHSLCGDMIVEKYNAETEEFENFAAENENSHNVIVTIPPLHPYMIYRDPYGYRFDRFRDNGQNFFYASREGSPDRMSTPPGFYSPVVSTTSGLSTPYLRPERTSAYVNSLSARQGFNNLKNSVSNDHSKRNSKSPLRQSVMSRNLEDAKNFRGDFASDDLRNMNRPNLSLSSRSSSKSPIRKF